VKDWLYGTCVILKLEKVASFLFSQRKVLSLRLLIDHHMKKLSYSEFMAAVKETKNYRSSANKEYKVTRVTKKELDLCDLRTKAVFTVDAQQVYAALAENGAAGCTVSCLKAYVGAKAAPASAALIYWTAGKGTDDPTYEDEVEERDKEELIADALTFGLPYTELELERMSKGALRQLLIDTVRHHTAEWIENLTVWDLKLLQELCERKGETLLEGTPQTLVTECLGFLDFSLQPVEGLKFAVHLYDDMRLQVAPYLKKAIESKLSRGEDVMEQALSGLINTVGTLTASEALETLCRLLPAYDARITVEGIQRFFERSMLAHELGYVYGSKPDTQLYSILLDTEDWASELRNNVQTLPLKKVEELLARGAFPYLQPYRPCEKAFYELFKQAKGQETADYAFTYYYMRLQDTNYEAKQMLPDVFDSLGAESKQVIDGAMPIVVNFYNDVPRFYLRGNTMDVLTARPVSPFVAPMKVGRNDPCPCGSGKKYKNCCGKN
jgi:hypothetical protein